MRKATFLIISALFFLPLQSYSLSHFLLEINPATNPTAGEYTPITITAYDAPGIPSTTFSGTVDLTNNTYPDTISPNTSENFTAGVWKGFVRLKAAGANEISCTDGSANGNTQVAVAANVVSQLLIILPGQTHTPGVNSGVTPVVQGGDYPDVIQGVYYGVTLLATDAYYNRVNSYTDTVMANEVGMSYHPSSTIPINAGIGYSTIETTTGSLTGSLVTVGFGSTPGLTFTPVYLTSFSSTAGFAHISTPSQVYAGEDFYVSVSIKASSDPNAPGGILTNNNDYFEFKKFYLSNNEELANNPNRDNLANFTVQNGVKYFNDRYFREATQIYLQAHQLTINGTTVYAVSSAPITILPNIPASVSLSLSPSEVQSNHQSIVSATVYDQYGNKTSSNIHDFHVTFHNTSTNGYLSVTATTTGSDNSTNEGVATSTYTAGTINEAVVLDVAVLDNVSSTVYAYQSVTVKVSVAPVEAGAIVNYPNPFDPGRNETTSINYYLEDNSNVELRIYDPYGRVVVAKNFDKDSTDPISLSATSKGGAAWMWDGKNGEGRTVANGIYLVKVRAQSSGKTQEFKRRVGVIK